MQEDMFVGSCAPIEIEAENATLQHYREWLSNKAASTLMTALIETLPWQQPNIKIAGRVLPIPRQQVWMGDPKAIMKYSGLTLAPEAWQPAIEDLKQKLEQLLQQRFNSVLINRYRDGQDSVGWHADDEVELGQSPCIASLSLGDTRRFLLKPKTPAKKQLGAPERAFDREPRRSSIAVDLMHGDLFVMAGTTQAHWQHSIPKTRQPKSERVNLTFRLIRNF